MASANNYPQRLWWLVAGDYLATAAAWFVFNLIRYYNIVNAYKYNYDNLGQFIGSRPVILGQIFIPFLMVGIYWLSGYYGASRMPRSRIEGLLTAAASTAVGCIIIFFAAIVNDPIPDRASNIELLLMLWSMMLVGVFAVRTLFDTSLRRTLRRNPSLANLIVVGPAKEANAVRQRLASSGRPFYYNPVGVVATDRPRAQFTLDNISHAVSHFNPKGIVLATPRGSSPAQNMDILSHLWALDLPVLATPSLFDMLAVKPRLRAVAGEPLIDLTSMAMSPMTANLKRVGDVAVASVALLLLSPVFALIALAIRRDSPGPVFYTQERVGRHRRPFRIVKFRTMQADAEKGGPALSCAGDPRVTRVGHFLRKYRLDELPQFYNVLRGDMSVVGPRPERAHYIEQIRRLAPYYTLVHQVRPGITSWGMVKAGYCSTVEEMVHRLDYDLIYMSNVSLSVDLKILFYTVNTVLTGKGV